ncbi:uncharacterized protein LOC127264097 [Andrographis paniculata]|uniref:uncharacterized protein LOC127264097 n=1 Tax=Andrographis paniculata TaxID=175694 RepID=UPI0021E8072B|nr:uncharacterized protein LOC127264097 [Andrographis paniculata]XP_051149434.1 uncharacterized protein LOC127264097 [Andrographis paniculata]XP_051149435.1 uncharacterized protein LOC127264097 [Andrographis paniculata]
MAMGTERSRALHNFTMPSELRWGNQRFLRCMKVNSSDGQISPLHRFTANTSGGSDHRNHRHPIQQRRTTRDRDEERGVSSAAGSEFTSGSPKVSPTPAPPESDSGRRFSSGEEGIAAVREKMMYDFQTEADKMKDAILDGLEERKASISPPPPPPPPEGGEAQRPWNLRTRRAASSKTSPPTGIVSGRFDFPTITAAAAAAGIFKSDLPKPNFLPPPPPTTYKSPINEATTSGGKRERSKFSVVISKKDIEEDFFAIAGHRPPRRPKRRAKAVQKELDCLFPGLWLTDVTPDMYKVNETAQ